MAALVAANDIKSTTYEDALLEIAEKMAVKEASTNTNPDGLDNVSVTYGANNTVTISYTGPVTKSVDNSGNIVISVTEYLS